jgi:hypothetical protein
MAARQLKSDPDLSDMHVRPDDTDLIYKLRCTRDETDTGMCVTLMLDHDLATHRVGIDEMLSSGTDQRLGDATAHEKTLAAYAIDETRTDIFAALETDLLNAVERAVEIPVMFIPEAYYDERMFRFKGLFGRRAFFETTVDLYFLSEE